VIEVSINFLLKTLKLEFLIEFSLYITQCYSIFCISFYRLPLSRRVLDSYKSLKALAQSPISSPADIYHSKSHKNHT